MIAADYLLHVTVNTGHQRRSPRAEVEEHVVEVMARWLDDVLLHEARRPLPVPGYSAEATTSPGGLVVTVYRDTGQPLVTFGIARRARGAPTLWRRLCELAGSATQAPPPAPWLAVVLLPALSHHADATRWLGDFERCVAWAWIERVAD